VQPCPQYERTYRQYLANDTGVKILTGDLQALGVTVSRLSRLELTDPDPVRIVGRHIDVLCELEVYQGKTRERWRVARRKKLSLGDVRALDGRFGGLLSATESPGGAIDHSVQRSRDTSL